MDDQSVHLNPEQLPFQLEDELGEIVLASQPYPDVYYIAAKKDEVDLFADEYYVVLAGTKTISQTVKKYGQAIPGYPELLVYPMADDKSGWRLVDYEGLRYLTQNHIPLPEQESLHETAVYSAEYHPEYFGPYPVPTDTPAGFTLRHRKLDNGIYWLETDRCEQMLTVCYPVWSNELSDIAQSLGQQRKYDQVHGINNTLGYLFFSEQDSCVPLFELMWLREGQNGLDLINKAALMNTVWQNFPEYAIAHNLEEQFGTHDYFGRLMNALGMEMELDGSAEYVITMSPEAGTEFICR